MKKFYKNPTIEITEFLTENIIRLSGGTDGAAMTADALGDKVGTGNVEQANLGSFTKLN